MAAAMMVPAMMPAFAPGEREVRVSGRGHGGAGQVVFEAWGVPVPDSAAVTLSVTVKVEMTFVEAIEAEIILSDVIMATMGTRGPSVRRAELLEQSQMALPPGRVQQKLPVPQSLTTSTPEPGKSMWRM